MRFSLLLALAFLALSPVSAAVFQIGEVDGSKNELGPVLSRRHKEAVAFKVGKSTVADWPREQNMFRGPRRIEFELPAAPAKDLFLHLGVVECTWRIGSNSE